jgi:2-octaprenyl-6-methoxyphenol hydroxylase
LKNIRVANTFDVVVVGAGPAGSVTALALSSQNIRTAIVAPAVSDAARIADTRSTALFGSSLELLRHLKVWPDLEPHAAPLVGLRLIDDTGGLLRSPETTFRAGELGLPCFGYNIENAELNRALTARIAAQSTSIRRHESSVTQICVSYKVVQITCRSDAELLTASVVVGADGRESLCRSAAEIFGERWSYPQSALAVRFKHSRPHDGISTEFHRRAGPLTTVPLRGNRSSLVWVDRPTEVERLRQLDSAAFALELEDRLQGLLGTVGEVGVRSAFPLSGLSVTTMGKNRVALVGEAAHVVPPIGAQGLNVGFRDAAWIAELVGAAKRRGEDIGGAALLEAYDHARRSDVGGRTLAVDLLNRSLFMDLLPLDVLRGAGLVALGALPWLRRFVMQQGVAPGADSLPPLLRPATFEPVP